MRERMGEREREKGGRRGLPSHEAGRNHEWKRNAMAMPFYMSKIHHVSQSQTLYFNGYRI